MPATLEVKPGKAGVGEAWQKEVSRKSMATLSVFPSTLADRKGPRRAPQEQPATLGLPSSAVVIPGNRGARG